MVDFPRRFFSALPRSLALGIVVLLVLLLGTVDLATGPEIGLSIFYVGPVVLATWFLGIRTGAGIALLAAGVWMIADLAAGRSYSHPLTGYWNTGVRLGFFLLTVYLLAQIRTRETRRRLLERIFFHDVLNVATGIRGYVELLRDYELENPREIYHEVHSAAEQIIEEIETQRALTAAESHDLHPEAIPVNAGDLLRRAVELYRHHSVAQGRKLVVATDCADLVLQSDPTLLLRILGNMLKNALEAARPGETVTAGCRRAGKRLEFWVHNPQFISRRDRTRIFHLSFSTKGPDRGLGTYSMKLLGDLLQGEVSFVSQKEAGTTFRLRLPLSPRP